MVKISLGPIQYYWKKQQVFDFYNEVSELPVERVYLGETVCSKRRELRLEDWLEIAQQLTTSGKQVCLSTMTLIEAASELSQLKKLCQAEHGFMVEANDYGAVQFCSESQTPFIAGAMLNLYNHRSVEKVLALGAQGWVMPYEITRQSLSALLNGLSPEVADKANTEVFSWGKVPLAYSARCFTARHHELPKDSCQLVCGEYPEGLALESQEQQRFLNINGIQTQSGHSYNLLSEWRDMQALGITWMRISPSLSNTKSIVETLANAIEMNSDIARACADDECNGYWFGRSGLERVA